MQSLTDADLRLLLSMCIDNIDAIDDLHDPEFEYERMQLVQIVAKLQNILLYDH